ncbi:hypothetical protein SCUCBS95973_001482 [Sporothrix curviconia]|uniref:Uncharacterized protein n=1 Tax=Sporothrix curviconia TaxID=1260050 RepID=A0ABP0AZJ9_9PEZI
MSTHLASTTSTPLAKLPKFPISVSIPRHSTIPSFVYNIAHSRSTRYQAIEYLLFLLEVARITTLCELAAGTTSKDQQTQRITLEWLLHQLASPDDFDLGEREIYRRIGRHKDLLRDRLRSVGLRYQTNHGEGMFMYIRPYRTLICVFGGGDSTYQPMRGFSTVARPTDQALTAANVARGLSIYEYMEGFFARQDVKAMRHREQVTQLWNEICTLYARLLGKPVETLNMCYYRPRSIEFVMEQYFTMSKAPGVEAALAAVLDAESKAASPEGESMK